MSILEAFIHDPLVEWEDEKRKKVRRFPMEILRALMIRLGETQEQREAHRSARIGSQGT
jgi:hypothetical protein